MTARKATPLERRDISADSPAVTDEGKIRGLAIPFNSFTLIGGGPLSFREKVNPKAVAKTLGEMDTVYLDNHDPAKPIARKSAGTLELRVTSRGVEYLAEPADTTYARDLVANVRAGNIKGNSFGFEVVRDAWSVGDDGIEERELLEIKLPEISACTFPAYEDTDIGMRNAYETAMECRDRYYERASSVSAKDRKSLAEKGHALPDGSYPIPDVAHLHAAAVLAASHHGDWQAAKELIRKRAKELGVDVNTLPGFGKDSDDRAAGELEQRDDPDGKEVAAMHEAVGHLVAGDYAAAQAVLEASLSNYENMGETANEGTDQDPVPQVAGGNGDTNSGVGHSTQGGSAVPLRALQDAYDEIRAMRPTPATEKVLAVLEPLLSTPDESEQRGEPKPDTSTSEIKIDSDSGLDLQKRWRDTQASYR